MHPSIKKLKGYGTNSKVCYRHRYIIGGSVVKFGNCIECDAQVNSNVGSPQKLCDQCSIKLNKCKHCLMELNNE